MQGVFQDPFSSYNPIFKADRVFGLIRDAFFPEVKGADWDERVHRPCRASALDPDAVLGKYRPPAPGGQLQRMLVARALLLDIEFLVADEMISMLDASTRVDVLNLLGDLKAGGLGVLFVTHDLSLGNYISDQAIILRKGRIVERGPTTAVFDEPDRVPTRGCCWPPCRRCTVDTTPGHWATWTSSATGKPASTMRYPGGDATAPATEANPTMVEVSAGHLVTCATVDEEGGCLQGGARPAAG